ncbi:MAG: hypothetical protein HC797_05260 [Anaerolineales bacterium]|nr:hypothetical protein [Anaerolineales bacterium]
MIGSLEPAKGSVRGVVWEKDSAVGVGAIPHTDEFPQAEIVNEMTRRIANMRCMLNELYLF